MAGSQEGGTEEAVRTLASPEPVFEARAVRSIETMRRRLDTPPSLNDLAREAGLTSWHFLRSFRRATGLPPGRFLSSLRMEEAKKRLLETNRRVTDVCFDLGFESLGSFTRRFTALVGVSPVAFRRLADSFSPKHLTLRMERQEQWKSCPGLRGVVTAPASFSGPIFVGLFPQAIPEGFPQSGALLPGPGPFHLPHAFPEGILMAAGIVSFHDPTSYLVPHEGLLVGVLPIGQRLAQKNSGPELHLRPPNPLDPPILVALLACLGMPDPSPG